MRYNDLLHLVLESKTDGSRVNTPEDLLVKKEDQLSRALADSRNAKKQLSETQKKLKESEDNFNRAVKSGNNARIAAAITGMVAVGYAISRKISDKARASSTSATIKDINRRLTRLKKDFKTGKISESQFRDEVNRLRQSITDAVR